MPGSSQKARPSRPRERPDDIIKVEDQYYILATAAAAEDRVRVLKHGDTFAVFDRYGDSRPVGLGEEGIYHEGTRFLSRLELRRQYAAAAPELHGAGRQHAPRGR